MGLDAGIKYQVTRPQIIEVAYFRKFWALQEWMGSYHARVNHYDGEFNCVNVPITSELLNELEHAIDDRYFERDMIWEIKGMIAKCRELLKIGEKPFYWSWW